MLNLKQVISLQCPAASVFSDSDTVTANNEVTPARLAAVHGHACESPEPPNNLIQKLLSQALHREKPRHRMLHTVHSSSWR